MAMVGFCFGLLVSVVLFFDYCIMIAFKSERKHYKNVGGKDKNQNYSGQIEFIVTVVMTRLISSSSSSLDTIILL